MQPLSHVRAEAYCTWGDPITMPSRPKLAAKIAECIAKWADIETMLGVFLGLLLEADSKAALAMYASLENRAAQLRLIMAAAEAKLVPAHVDVLTCVMQVSLRPAMKDRDKLAHWCWGFSPDLPHDLLIAEPDEKMTRHFRTVHGEVRFTPGDPERIYVVTETWLGQLSTRLQQAEQHVTEFAATTWSKNTQQ